MTPAQQTVLGELLDYAGDLMSNKVCNDMEIPDTPENREMLLDFYKWQLHEGLDGAFPDEYQQDIKLAKTVG